MKKSSRILTAALLSMGVLSASFQFSAQAQSDVTFTAEQRTQLDQIYARAAEQGAGKSLEEQKAIARNTMPEIIKLLEPTAKAGNYAKVFNSSPAVQQAAKELATSIGFINASGAIDFYP